MIRYQQLSFDILLNQNLIMFI